MNRRIPPFNRYGLLPNGVHLCDQAAFCKRFRDDFPRSRSRPRIMEGFSRLRHDALGKGICAVQWIDGSFVENREPRDVDVVHFIDFDLANTLDQDAQRFIMDVLGGRQATKAAYNSHCFFVFACDRGHPFHETYERLRRYWRKWFGTTRPRSDSKGRTIPGRKKGIIRLNLGDEQKLPTVWPEEVPDGR